MNIPVTCHAASLIVIREDSPSPQMLLLKRTCKTLKDQWLHVAGGIEEGEKPWQTVIRELKEETGLTVQKLYSANICEQFYNSEMNELSIVPVFVGYTENPEEVILNHEHTDFCWVTFDKAIELGAFPNHGKLYSEIHEYFVLKKPNPLMEVSLKQA